MSRGVAVFDFDRTLVRQETLAIFLRLLAGRTACLSACCMAAAKASTAAPAARMGIFRAELLRRTLADRPIGQAQEAASRLYTRLTWISQVTDDLLLHQAAGRKILIATGSLSVYMPTILQEKGFRVDGLLSTEMEVNGGVLTGRMVTPSCTWSEKARRVKEWLADEPGPVWGYGNLPPDEAMLDLADHPTVIPA